MSFFRSTGKEDIFVGHSLGGAVAQLVGQSLGKRAVGFASPGIKGVTKKYNWSTLREGLSRTIAPSCDFVHRIDEHAHLDKIKPDWLFRPGVCHQIGTIIAELRKMCGGGRTRTPLHRVNYICAFIEQHESGN